jgi:adenylate kinase
MNTLTEKPRTFIFFGIAGSGKGTQVKLLTDYLKNVDGHESVYAGTGEGFRSIVSSGTFTSELIKEMMARGQYVVDFLGNTIFTNILISNLTPDKHLIADGYPRTAPQSENFDNIIKFYKRDDLKIIYIDVGREEAIKRSLLRARPDDTQDAIEKRYDEYIEKVIPSMNYFKDKSGYTIYTINGEQSIEDVHRELIAKLGM